MLPTEPRPQPATTMLHVTTAMVLGKPVYLPGTEIASQRFTPVGVRAESVRAESGGRTGWIVDTASHGSLFVATPGGDGLITEARRAA